MIDANNDKYDNETGHDLVRAALPVPAVHPLGEGCALSPLFVLLLLLLSLVVVVVVVVVVLLLLLFYCYCYCHCYVYYYHHYY